MIIFMALGLRPTVKRCKYGGSNNHLNTRELVNDCFNDACKNSRLGSFSKSPKDQNCDTSKGKKGNAMRSF